MSIKLEDRVLVLEISKIQFDKEFEEMKEDTKILKKGLSDINVTLKQTRNIVVAIAVTAMAMQYGLIDVLKVALSAGL